MIKRLKAKKESKLRISSRIGMDSYLQIPTVASTIKKIDANLENLNGDKKKNIYSTARAVEDVLRRISPN